MDRNKELSELESQRLYGTQKIPGLGIGPVTAEALARGATISIPQPSREDQILKPSDYNSLDRLGKFDWEISRARRIFQDRNAIYKDTFVHLGILGTVITLIGDVFRLRNMIVQNPEHGRGFEAQIEDKLIDVINQATITLMMLREENYEGK